jgi:hypothetical protein
MAAESGHDGAFGAASNVTPKFVSPSDPAAQVNKQNADAQLPVAVMRVLLVHSLFADSSASYPYC